MLKRPPSVADRVRQRIKEELVRLGWSQRDLAEKLEERTGERWTQPGVAKITRGRVHLRLNDVADIAEALGVPFLEMVRDRGLEFVAEMTPTEVRVFERLRRLSADETHAVLTILGLSSSEQTRYAGRRERPAVSTRPPSLQETARGFDDAIDTHIAARRQTATARAGGTRGAPRFGVSRQPPAQAPKAPKDK